MADLITKLGASAPDLSGSLLKRSLEAVRAHLGMDVAYVSEFVGDRSVFREVDAPGLEHLAAPGDARPLDEVYCRHIVEGRIPELIPDTADVPLAAAMPITRAIPIGSHVSVPIRRDDGEVYGMFCCLSAAPRPSLNDRDLHIVRAFAGLVAEEIGRDGADKAARAAKLAAVREAFRPGALAIHLQPICDILTGRAVGFEALSRFSIGPVRSPDRWFAEAAEVGLGLELEAAAIEAAAAVLPSLPEPLYLSVNAAPATIAGGALEPLLAGEAAHRIVIEVTEHAGVDDYEAIHARLAGLRARGARLAVDDAGAGFAGLQHILRLRPDLIKLDMALIRGIDADPARRALAAAMQGFARQTGAALVAEGVETGAERQALTALGFRFAQGYLFGRPKPHAEVVETERGARAA